MSKWVINTEKTRPTENTLIAFVGKNGKFSAGYVCKEIWHYDYYDGATDVPIYRLVCVVNNCSVPMDEIFAYTETNIPKSILKLIKPTPRSTIGQYLNKNNRGNW